jgi:hypothetical protein
LICPDRNPPLLRREVWLKAARRPVSESPKATLLWAKPTPAVVRSDLNQALLRANPEKDELRNPPSKTENQNFLTTEALWIFISGDLTSQMSRVNYTTWVQPAARSPGIGPSCW